MPTFTAIALDRLLEPGSRNASAKPPPAPPPPARAERLVPISSSARKVIPKRHVSPTLYATPESTPLPDSPSSASSFPPPSPYIINHKRRGPRLLKSLSQSDVGNIGAPPQLLPPLPLPLPLQPEQKLEVVNGNGAEEKSNGYRHEEKARRDDEQAKDPSSSDGIKGDEDSTKVVDVDAEKEGESEDFFDLQDSMSTVSNLENDDGNGADRSPKPTTPIGEFYDAFEGIDFQGSRYSSQS